MKRVLWLALFVATAAIAIHYWRSEPAPESDQEAKAGKAVPKAKSGKVIRPEPMVRQLPTGSPLDRVEQQPGQDKRLPKRTYQKPRVIPRVKRPDDRPRAEDFQNHRPSKSEEWNVAPPKYQDGEIGADGYKAVPPPPPPPPNQGGLSDFGESLSPEMLPPPETDGLMDDPPGDFIPREDLLPEDLPPEDLPPEEGEGFDEPLEG